MENSDRLRMRDEIDEVAQQCKDKTIMYDIIDSKSVSNTQWTMTAWNCPGDSRSFGLFERIILMLGDESDQREQHKVTYGMTLSERF